jgi:hypothetical protein
LFYELIFLGLFIIYLVVLAIISIDNIEYDIVNITIKIFSGINSIFGAIKG